MNEDKINKILQDFGQYKVNKEQEIKEDIRKEIESMNPIELILNPDSEFDKLKNRIIDTYMSKYMLDIIKKKDSARNRLIKELMKVDDK